MLALKKENQPPMDTDKKGWERHFKKPVLSGIDLLPNRSKPKLHSIGNAALGLS
ncbi:MAG: hypothetical protein Q8O00_16495 [Holophaga sp.]|nr:hypothetical protein [Holophaga sp.]